MRNFNKVRIINCKARENEGKAMQKLLQRKADGTEISIAFDPDMSGAWKTYRKAMEVNDDADFLILMEDDISFPIDVLQRMDHILDSAPRDGWIFFYVPTNGEMQKALESGKHVLKAKGNWWPQVTAIPKASRLEFLSVIDNYFPEHSKSGDGRILRYFYEHNVFGHTIIPSLFQHLGTWRSALGYNGKVGQYVRNSFCYSPDFNVYEIDWKNEFENPYKDNQVRPLGWAKWKVGMPTDGYNDGGFQK